mmetsp:Transcript_9647/g.36222  ORF Transcript_9647/g.36222 Transcript_9647/m.36222 type:complete len:448 (-) Transcript_9647:1415-2758(-)
MLRAQVFMALLSGLLGTSALRGRRFPLLQNMGARAAYRSTLLPAARARTLLGLQMCSGTSSESDMVSDDRELNEVPAKEMSKSFDAKLLKQVNLEVEKWAHWIWPEDAKPESVQVRGSSAVTIEDFVTDFWSAFSYCVQLKIEAEDRGGAVDRWLVLLTAPGVESLRDYENMRRLDHILDFCKNTCYPAADVVRLMHYHPRFRGKKPLSGDRWNNEVHAPYPTFAFVITNGKNIRLRNRGPTGVGGGRNAPHWRDTAAVNLDILFNTAVAASVAEPLTAHGAPDGKIPSLEKVQELMEEWVTEQQATEEGSEADGLLRSTATVVVSDARSPQEVYKAAWEAIASLAESEALPASTPLGAEPMRSILLVTPHYATFNQGKFERIAYAMDKAVAHAPLGHKLDVKSFHPEFVGGKDENTDTRRAPFPVLQISYFGPTQAEDAAFEGPMP